MDETVTSFTFVNLKHLKHVTFNEITVIFTKKGLVLFI